MPTTQAFLEIATKSCPRISVKVAQVQKEPKDSLEKTNNWGVMLARANAQSCPYSMRWEGENTMHRSCNANQEEAKETGVIISVSDKKKTVLC